MGRVELKWESWDEFGPEFLPLAGIHYAEVEGPPGEAPDVPNHPYNPNAAACAAMCAAGTMLCLAGRREGVLVGYITWRLTSDLESRDCIQGFQGAWYVVPGERRSGRLALALFNESVRLLNSIGVTHLILHHREHGGGREAGKFFERLGAKRQQTTYALALRREAGA